MDIKIVRRQEKISKKEPIIMEAKNELDIELDDRIPQILPRQTTGYQFLIRFAIEGQPADLASMEIKNVSEKKGVLRNHPK